MKIHLVQGNKGEHDDYVTWIVDAWTSPEAAAARADALNKGTDSLRVAAKQLGIAEFATEGHAKEIWDNWITRRNELVVRAREQLGDPNIPDFDDAIYVVLEVELREAEGSAG